MRALLGIWLLGQCLQREPSVETLPSEHGTQPYSRPAPSARLCLPAAQGLQAVSSPELNLPSEHLPQPVLEAFSCWPVPQPAQVPARVCTWVVVNRRVCVLRGELVNVYVAGPCVPCGHTASTSY